MASDSDSDCELYTKTAERIKFQSVVGEIEEVMDLAVDDDELNKIMQEVGSGISPMEALINVQTETMMKARLKEQGVISLVSQSSSSDSDVNSSPSIDITMYDTPGQLRNGKKKNARAPKNKSVTNATSQSTRKSTRSSTMTSTMASLKKTKTTLTPKKNLDSASKEVDICTNVINGNDIVQADVVVIEDHERAEELGSMTRRSRRKRGRSSRANRNVSNTQIQTATTSSNSRDLGTIVLDDDLEYFNVLNTPIEFNKRYNCKIPRLNNDSSSDEEASYDNIPVKVTIEWSNDKGLVRKLFSMRKYEKFQSVFEALAKLEGIPVSRVVLMQRFTTIRPADSPATLNMNFYGALTGFVSDTELVYDETLKSLAAEENEKKLEGAISVKVQLESKQTLVFNLAKKGKMDTLYLMACEELNCDKDELKLYFDGEYVPPNEKLSSLDIEDGDIFHARIKK